MNELQKKVWDKCSRMAEKAAESLYPATQPDRRRDFARKEAVRRYRMYFDPNAC